MISISYKLYRQNNENNSTALSKFLSILILKTVNMIIKANDLPWQAIK